MQAVEAQPNPPWFIFSCGFGFCHIRRIAYPIAYPEDIDALRLRRFRRATDIRGSGILIRFLDIPT
jgi:hypothetical protein